MKRAPGLLLLAVLMAAGPARAQLTLELAVPPGTPDTAAVYVAGTFNGWAPGDPAYRLVRTADGAYTLTLPDSIRGDVAFKFTLGSWQAVERDAGGGDVPNRTFTVPPHGAATFTGRVAVWRDAAPEAAPASTASPSVTVLDTAFAMPQLGRTRRVWLYLPPDYATSDKRYPVLYLHDGQNVFDQATSFAGEWEVDETLDRLHAAGDPGAIVVAVDNGGTHRFDEYSPWMHPKYGGGQGDAYVAFLVEELKPYIDQHYRTHPDRLHTGIAGSSMGGLISLYAALAYPDVFGRAGVFSPALWVAPESYAFAHGAEPLRPDPRLYFVSGALEGRPDERGVYQQDQRRMIDTLAAAGFRVGVEVDSLIQADGTHSEWFWRREFADAYQWLFADAPAPGKAGAPPAFSLYPAPDRSVLTARFADPGSAPAGASVEVVDTAGRVVATAPLHHGTARIDVRALPAGAYVVRAGPAARRWVKL